jgi:nitrile hydratase
MDGAHDLGGMHGFGPIECGQQQNFVGEWEEKVFGLTLACGMQGKWNLDQSRFARERMDPAHYLGSSYYEHWLHGLELLLVERGLLSAKELESGVAEPAGAFKPVPRERARGILEQGSPTLMECERNAVWQVGDWVRIRNEHPHHHTRMPRYIRGRCGEIVHHYGAHIFPDAHSESGEKVPSHLYNVRFSGEELWGDQAAETNSAIYVDVFEPYIEGAAS